MVRGCGGAVAAAIVDDEDDSDGEGLGDGLEDDEADALAPFIGELSARAKR